MRKVGAQFPQRLKQLRIEQNLLQKDVANYLSKNDESDTAMTNSSVSYWENGKRIPRLQTLMRLAELFDVSVEYLTGASNERGSYEEVYDFSETYKDKKGRVDHSQLWKYDGKPLYVVFPDTKIMPMWGLYDASNDKIVFTNQYLQNASKTNIECYETEFTAKALYKPLDFSACSPKTNMRLCTKEIMLRSDRVYVELLNPSDYICGMYNGFYTHNNDHTCLVDDKGHCLHYNWLGDAYNAYYEVNTD